MAMIGLGILILLLLMAAFAPLISPHDPFEQNLMGRLQPLWAEGHILGTDSLGRDLLSRVIYDSRITLYIVTLVKAKGKPHKLVQIAVARKLLITANAVLKRGTPWQEAL